MESRLAEASSELRARAIEDESSAALRAAERVGLMSMDRTNKLREYEIAAEKMKEQAIEEEATPTLIDVWKELGVELIHEEENTEDEAEEEWDYESTTEEDEDDDEEEDDDSLANSEFLSPEEKALLESEASWQDKMKIEILLHDRRQKAQDAHAAEDKARMEEEARTLAQRQSEMEADRKKIEDMFERLNYTEYSKNDLSWTVQQKWHLLKVACKAIGMEKYRAYALPLGGYRIRCRNAKSPSDWVKIVSQPTLHPREVTFNI